MVQEIEHLTYDVRLKNLGLTRLDKRRNRSDLIETFKILNGIYDINSDSYFQLDNSDCRGHSKNCLNQGPDST